MKNAAYLRNAVEWEERSRLGADSDAVGVIESPQGLFRICACIKGANGERNLVGIDVVADTIRCGEDNDFPACLNGMDHRV